MIIKTGFSQLLYAELVVRVTFIGSIHIYRSSGAPGGPSRPGPGHPG